MSQLATLTPELHDALADDPEAESELEDAHDTVKETDEYDVEPTVAEVEAMFSRLRPTFDMFHTMIQEAREIRYGQDETPEKWRRRLQGSRRFRSRLSHNEDLRVAAMMTRNQPKVKVPVSGRKAADEKKADAQTRWANNLLRAFERRSSRPLFRRICDNIAADGMGFVEFYLTNSKAYQDAEAATPREFFDPKIGMTRPETADEVMERMDDALKGAPLPFGIRVIDPLCVLFEEDDNGICRALIVEEKPYIDVFSKLKDPDGKKRLPKPGTPGWPTWQARPGNEDGDSFFSETLGGEMSNNAQSTVLTFRFYSGTYWKYIVGGIVVEEGKHGLPGIPVFHAWGMTTGSPNLHEMAEGITWGMAGMELAVNDLMTLSIDTAYTYGRPKPVVITDAQASRAETRDRDSKKPKTLDLSTDSAPFLDPGQRLEDAYKDFRANQNHEQVRAILEMWQRSGLNPVAQGESPGSDVAGYTVNTLSQAAQSQYEILLDNYARMLEKIVDFARMTVRDTLEEKVFLAVEGKDKKDATEWLAIGPEDVDDTPSIVTIDPLSDANRMALRQSLMQGNKEGYVPRAMVQESYGMDDPAEADRQLAIEAGVNDLVAMAREDAKSQIFNKRAEFLQQQQGGAAAAAGGGAPGAGGAPPPQGSQPAPVGPPGAPPASGPGVTQPGPAAMSASAAQAGQGQPGVAA